MLTFRSFNDVIGYPTVNKRESHQDRFAELAADRRELANVHHGVVGDQHEEVAEFRREAGHLARGRPVQIGPTSLRRSIVADRTFSNRFSTPTW